MEDEKLTDHFTLYELTKTNHLDLQEKNRDLTKDQAMKLVILAHLMEIVRAELECPLVIHSGYRCLELNMRIGSTNKSQHMLCEACDFVPKGLDVGNAFRILWKAVRDSKIKVGQLIYETQQRGYGIDSWIHVSMGEPWRDKNKSNQVLRMIDGTYTIFEEKTV